MRMSARSDSVATQRRPLRALALVLALCASLSLSACTYPTWETPTHEQLIGSWETRFPDTNMQMTLELLENDGEYQYRLRNWPMMFASCQEQPELLQNWLDAPIAEGTWTIRGEYFSMSAVATDDPCSNQYTPSNFAPWGLITLAWAERDLPRPTRFALGNEEVDMILDVEFFRVGSEDDRSEPVSERDPRNEGTN